MADWVNDPRLKSKKLALAMNRATFDLLTDNTLGAVSRMKSGDDIRFDSQYGIRIVLDDWLQDGEVTMGYYSALLKKARAYRKEGSSSHE